MSSLKIQLHSNTAKSPYAYEDGRYDIYSDEAKTLLPGHVCPIATNISIEIPLGFCALIQSCELAISNRISTFSYSSLNDNERFIQRLIIYLHNGSNLPKTLNISDVIAKLTIIRYKVFAVEIVENINNREALVAVPKYKSLPNNAGVWFKRTYSTNPSDIETKYLTDDIIAKVEEFKKGDMYNKAINKPTVLSNYMWEILPKEIQIKINADFTELKHSSLAGDSDKNTKMQSMVSTANKRLDQEKNREVSKRNENKKIENEKSKKDKKTSDTSQDYINTSIFEEDENEDEDEDEESSEDDESEDGLSNVLIKKNPKISKHKASKKKEQNLSGGEDEDEDEEI